MEASGAYNRGLNNYLYYFYRAPSYDYGIIYPKTQTLNPILTIEAPKVEKFRAEGLSLAMGFRGLGWFRCSGLRFRG